VSDARRSEEIARAIRDDILRGRYRPGERLPSERELADQAGANRGSAREALQILAQQRLIEIRPGGSRVVPLERASLDVLGHMLQRAEGPDAALMAQLLDVHELFLVGAVRLAVERASHAELERARALLDVMSSERTRDDEYLRTLTALAELIADASRNLVLRMVGNGLLGVLAKVVPVLRRLRPPRATLAPAIASVRRALAKRDPAAAEWAIRRLLRIQREYVLKRLEIAATASQRAHE
jgi:GntR family transcriptional regulator, transcriptional repressor for pyruvate dehydrogenase complex